MPEGKCHYVSVRGGNPAGYLNALGLLADRIIVDPGPLSVQAGLPRGVEDMPKPRVPCDDFDGV